MTFVPARMIPDPVTPKPPTPPPGSRQPFVPARMFPDPPFIAPLPLSIQPDQESLALAWEAAQRLAAFRAHLASLVEEAGEDA